MLGPRGVRGAVRAAALVELGILWEERLGPLPATPIIVNGTVYVHWTDGQLRAFRLPETL
jgi:hypothetical protein